MSDTPADLTRPQAVTLEQTAGGQAAAERLSLSTDAPPARVDGYRIEQFVGAGAFGQIWLAIDINTGRRVAIKFYLHRDAIHWTMLSREVKSLVQLSSDRRVVQVLQVGWDAPIPYYVMEWIAGGSLEDRLRGTPALSIDDAMSFFRQILEGLNHCHGKGVLHCDLKPANILIGDDDELRLTDFGQSRLASDQTPALGTLFYMAPEQADLAATPDARWDVYAAGAILYRMLTGDMPHRDRESIGDIEQAETLQSRLAAYRRRITSTDTLATHLLNRRIDRRIIKIVCQCLHPDPALRYPNVQSILDDIAARDQARTRRPLYIIGIVGPLLIGLMIGLFGYRSINAATSQSVEALRSEATNSNATAASLAARSMELELNRYFELVRGEASRPAFVDRMKILLADESLRKLRDQIVAAQTPAAALALEDVHQRVLDNDVRRSVDKYLQTRLARYLPGERTHRPRLATVFVTDASGTILTVAFDRQVSDLDNSAGRNFAYRTYFHGGKSDREPSAVNIGDVPPLQQTHMSAPFQSTSTRRWKIAISTPVDLDDDQTIDAVFVATIGLGDFEIFQSADTKQWTVVVDARPGPTRGTILEHPMWIQSNTGVDSSVAVKNYRIDPETLDKLLAHDSVDYHDPISNLRVNSATPANRREDQFDTSGDNAWIAAISPVSLPNEKLTEDVDAAASTGDLMVMVQYRLEAVLAPVRQLRRTLLSEGFAGLLSIAIVSVLVWWLATRDGRSKSLELRDSLTMEPPETLNTP